MKTWSSWKINSKEKAKLFTLEVTCVKNVTGMEARACFESHVSVDLLQILEYPGRLM